VIGHENDPVATVLVLLQHIGRRYVSVAAIARMAMRFGFVIVRLGAQRKKYGCKNEYV
jgi:hypothetical protein